VLTSLVRESRAPEAPKPRLLDRVREAIRARHYSRRTEKTYVAWIRRYIFFHGKRHPAEMGAREITDPRPSKPHAPKASIVPVRGSLLPIGAALQAERICRPAA